MTKRTKVLIIKIAAIGDVALALPMIAALKSESADCEISWMVGTTAAPLVRSVDEIEHIIEIDDKRLLGPSKALRIWELLRVWKKTLFNEYDLVLVAHSNRLFNLLLLAVRFKQCRSFSGSNIRPGYLLGRHRIAENIRLAVGQDDFKLKTFDFPKVLLEQNPINLGPRPAGVRVICLCPGGAKNVYSDDFVRRWPIECYVELASKLISEGNIIVIAGAASDTWVLPYFENIDHIVALGKTSITGLLALFNDCDIIVSHDSGPLHLAALIGKPVIGLFGPTSPINAGPIHPNSASIVTLTPMPCSPCYSGRTYAACADNVCMKSITVTQVLKRIKEILSHLLLPEKRKD